MYVFRSTSAAVFSPKNSSSYLGRTGGCVRRGHKNPGPLFIPSVVSTCVMPGKEKTATHLKQVICTIEPFDLREPTPKGPQCSYTTAFAMQPTRHTHTLTFSHLRKNFNMELKGW